MIPQLRPASLPDWLAQHAALDASAARTPLVLDVREPWEWDTASIKPLAGSPAWDVMPMQMQTIPQRLAELPQDRPILCLCHHGMRSQQVAAFLLNRGFEQVINLSGGIDAWSRELDPSVPHY
jgi:rhodanese-related sulfurtransferase